MNRGGSGLIQIPGSGSSSQPNSPLGGLDETKSGAGATPAPAKAIVKPTFTDLQTTPNDEITVKVVHRNDTHATSKLV